MDWAAFGRMAVVQFSWYLVVVINVRAIAHKKYPWAVGTDAIASLFSALVVVNVVADHSLSALVGLMAGGGLASAAGIWLTQHWGGGHG